MYKEKSLIKTFIGTSSLNLFARSLTLISGIIYARFLGPEQYGLYGYVMSIIALLSLPVIAGMPELIVREVANFSLDKKWNYLAGVINWSRIYILVMSFIVLFISIIMIDIEFFKVKINELLLFALLLIPLIGLLTQQGAILNGLGKPILSLVPGKILGPAITIGLVSVFILNKIEITGDVLIKTSVISSFFAWVLSASYLKKIEKQKFQIKKNSYLIKQWHVSLVPFTLMAIVSTLNTELASVFLGWLDNTESVAFLKVAMQGMILIALGLNSINMIIMPQIAQLYKQGDLMQTQKLLSKSVRLSCVFSLPIIVILIIFGEFAIEVIFGTEYVPAYPLLVVLCIGQIVNVLMGSVGLVLNMTNNESSSLRSLIIALLISITLLLILIPKYSALGSAISVSISLIVWNILMSFDVYRLTGLKTWVFYNHKV